MKQKFLLKTMLLLSALIAGSGTMWGQTWSRVTSIQTLLDGGTFIMGYENTAKSGVIIPLRSKDCGATTSANGIFNSGTTNGNSTSGTIDMSDLSEVTTGDYEVYITASSTDGYINIQRTNNTGNYYGSSSGGSSKNTARLYTSGNSNETNLLPEWDSETNNQFKLKANVSGSYKYFKYNTGSPRFAFYNSAGEKIVFYKKAPACATPTFSVAAGEVTKNTVVTISSTTTGSTIYYTTNGDTPTTSSAHGTAGDASAEVTISSDMTVKAIAVKDGNSNSAVASASYTTAKAANTITVTGGTTQNIALTGGSAIEDGMYDLSEIVSATHGTLQYAIKETTNLTEDTDFEFAEGLFEFTNTYKGIIVVTASVPADEDYYAVEQDITINCSGDLRTPSYSFNDGDKLAMGQTITVVKGTNITSDGDITLTSSNTSVATVNNTTKVITPVAVGKTSITIATAEGTYYASGSKTFELEIEYAKGSAQNPYTVAEAKYAIDNSGTTDDVYVKGIVCTGGSSLSSGTLIYWISDDGTETNKFEIYKGKGLDNASFSSTSDIQVGDKVTVYGDITLYNSTTYEFSAGSYITSFFRKANSNLTLTSSTPVALEMTSSTPHPTSTITYTTSSEGAMTFTTSDGSVATVSDGVITAVGAGTATITFSQAADEAYKASENKTVTVNVTDNRSACATGIDLSSAKTIVKGASAAISATSTKADGFTGSITYSYSSASSSIFSITDGIYSGAGVGATTVTVTATPTGGNADNYKAASREVAVTVNGTNSISLDLTSKSVAYGAAAFDIEATVPTENYDGTVTASSSNTSVATVSVDGTTVTVTPKSIVGTATITVTAGTDTYYLETAQATCDLNITAPEGKTTFSSEVTVFEETFDTNDGTGGNDDSWSGSIASKDIAYDNSGWTSENGKGADRCAKFGTSKAGGSAQTPALGQAGTFTLTFKAAAWDGASEGTSLSVSASNAALRNADDTDDVSSVTLTKGAWTTYTLTVKNATADAKITFSTSSGYQRFFLDEVKVTKSSSSTATVTLNKYGYATYCSVNPIDFSSTEGYTAWRVNSIASDGTITFKKITEKIKGGQGVLLFNKDADEKNTSNATVNFANGSTVFDNGSDGNDENDNLLVGTTASTYVATETVYGLSNAKFVKNNAAGTIPAGKAYINASSIPADVKAFTFVFEDEADGIAEMRQATREEVEAIFNLAGQRISRMQKGINIVNGKKIMK